MKRTNYLPKQIKSFQYALKMELVSLGHCMRNLCLAILIDDECINRYCRPLLLQFLGMRIGARCKISKAKYHGSLKKIQIGNHVFINTQCFFHAGGKIMIGNRVIIGFEVSFITGHHEIGPARCRCGDLIRKDIHIEDGVWIGSRALIGPGVTIGKGSVVAAGAIVMCSVPPNTVVGGVPAKVIRTLEDRISPNDNVERRFKKS